MLVLWFTTSNLATWLQWDWHQRVPHLAGLIVMGSVVYLGCLWLSGTRSLLEVHLFGFDRDIYGQYVQVEFFKKLRDEKKFDSFELLKQQILKDAAEAHVYFETVDSV